MNREAGILLPISSLPSKYGIGCFSDEAYAFVDLLSECHQGVWQILPLCPTSYGDSPYQSPCSFAGNPYFISPEHLMREGLLTEAECDAHSADHGNRYVDYGLLYEKRYPLLYLAYRRFASAEKSDEYSEFLTENSYWLYDYALFAAIKSHLGSIPLSAWDEGLRKRDPRVLETYAKTLSDSIGFQLFLQYKFFSQWQALKAYANKKGVRILGDIPIYVSADSSDLWVFPELFMLDEKGLPLSVAGCPPDGFSPKGQLWGNPLYDWNAHIKSDFDWWCARIRHAYSMYDIVRIDHFRGFESFYSIPYGAEDATGGHWERGVGRKLFCAVEKRIGKKKMIAEDLGYITDGVRELVRSSGFMGMKIIQFGFDGGDGDFSSEYLPHNYERNTVVYTGTHDNPTLSQWLCALSEGSERMLREYLPDDTSRIFSLQDKVIALAMKSVSELCIIPMQDYLCVGSEGRMNTPSAPSGNWCWRLNGDDLCKNVKDKIKHLTKIGGRG